VLEQADPGFAVVAPPPALRGYIERLWAHRIAGPPPPGGHRLFPDGRIDLIWIAGLGVRISGPQRRFFRPPDHVPSMVALGATFHPGAAPYLLRTPASALADRHVPLDAIDPRLAARLDDRLGAAPDLRTALAAFARELTRALRDRAAPDPAVRHAVRLLDGRTATVAGVAERTFVSERALQRRFAEDVGYGPKTLQRVLRFQRFMGQVRTPRLDLARAALHAGYADQSHLTREARRLSGLSPRQLRGWTH